MRCVIIINRNAGSLEGRDPGPLVSSIVQAFTEAGYDCDHRLLPASELDDALDRAAGEDDVDLLVAGGGDGTLAAFLSRFASSGRTVACLPLGTMNLFCRSIGIPTDPEEAARQIAGGDPVDVDLGYLDGRYFLFHLSLGMQPMTVTYRNRHAYKGRFAKMWASFRAFMECLGKPPVMSLEIETDGRTETIRTPALSIIGNPFREELFGMQRQLASGRLGVYAALSGRRIAVIRVALKTVLLRRVRDKDFLVREAENITIRRADGDSRPLLVSHDGEIREIDPPLEAVCRQGAVRLMLPPREGT